MSTSATGGKQAITTSITLPDCAKGLQWYQDNLGAKVTSKYMSKDGSQIMHSSVLFPNDAVVYFTDHLAEFNKQDGMQYPSLTVGNPYNLCLLFKDEPSGDAFWNDRVKKADSVRIDMEFEFQFWGDKFGTFTDPFGHVWNVMVFGKPPDTSTASTSSESGKKRSLSDAHSTDESGTKDDTSDSSTKRSKTSSSTVSEDAANEVTKFCWTDLRNRALNEELKTRDTSSFQSLGFFEIESPVSCLAIEFKVGSKTGVTFNHACNDGFMKLNELNKSPDSGLNDQLKIVPALAFSPENPEDMDPVRYSPALMLKSDESLDALKSQWDGKDVGTGTKTKSEMKLSVLPIDQGKMFIALHLGSYEGMKESWKKAIAEVEESGHVCFPEQCFESYFNNPCDTAEKDLRSAIHIAVRPKA